MLPSVQVTMKGANEVEAMVSGALQRTSDLTKPMKMAGVMMVGSIRRNFSSSGRPSPWRPLAPSTLKEKARKGYSSKPLIRSGAAGLEGSINYQADRTSVRIGTPIVYGRIHQYGGFAGRGRASFIPARPYLVFQGEDLKRINKLVVQHVTGVQGA